jgi:DNA-binding beta-propeller fold protein YncE
VVVSNDGGLTGLDFAAGRVAYRTPSAVGSPDGNRFYVVEESQLSALDGLSGARIMSMPVPAGLEAVTVSGDGHRVALAQPDVAHSRIAIADTSAKAGVHQFDLPGRYQPDAFSSDNERLFVLEYLPASAPDRYRVRQLDLRTGVLSGMLGRFKQPVPEEEMRGTRHGHVLSPDRQTLYTLYTNQPDHLHSRDLARGLTQSSAETYAFVHVLNLVEGWAYCLDLPQPFGVGPASSHAIALSPDGRSLYVADRSSGAVAVADTAQLVVRDVANVGADTSATGAAATVTADGRLLLGDASGVLVLSGRSLAVQQRIPLGLAPTGLGISRDGQRLLVGSSDRLLVIDLLTGSGLGEMTAAGLQRIEYIR